MKIKYNSRAGITLIGAILLIVCAGLAGYGLWYIYKKVRSKTESISDIRNQQFTNALVNIPVENFYVAGEEQVDSNGTTYIEVENIEPIRLVSFESSGDLVNWTLRICDVNIQEGDEVDFIYTTLAPNDIYFTNKQFYRFIVTESYQP